MVLFRPALEGQTWLDGDVWLTNGQRWFGPFPPDLAPPFSWRWSATAATEYLLNFCHTQWNRDSADPICIGVPDSLEIEVYFDVPRGIYVPGGSSGATEAVRAKLVPCGEAGQVCLEAGDCPSGGCPRSRPIRFPLPEPLGTSIPYSHVRGCADWRSDPLHAVFAIPRFGDPLHTSSFPGGLYWVDLRSGQVRVAPTNAPSWPEQQALVRAASEREILPLTFPSFLEDSEWGPTIEAEQGCSPSGQFMLVAQGIWHPAARVHFPEDVRRTGASDEALTAVWILWVIRIEDGVGYPVAVREAQLNRRYALGWVEPMLRPLFEYQLPDYGIPWW